MDQICKNKFLKPKGTFGRRPFFKDAEELASAAMEYFKWVEENPLYETKLVSYQGDHELQDVPKMRAMTIGGLCLFLDISLDTWCVYKKKDGFVDVTRLIDEAIRDQKFAGAAANLLNANIIARDLGLKDESGPQVIINNNLTVEEEMKQRGIPIPEIEMKDIEEEEEQPPIDEGEE